MPDLVAQPFDFTCKVGVVSGASGGIGRAAAEVPANLGSRVVLAGRAAGSTSFVAVADPDTPAISIGPLTGLVYSVKDNIDVAGMPTTVGTAVLGDVIPEQTAPVVRALRDAGASLLGKNNMYELALGNTGHNWTFGHVATPLDPLRSAGGSSGGSAAAVADGLVDFALGTDTGGSVRTPAAFCGVVGFRPTRGRYSTVGIAPLSSSRDTVGILARDIATVSRVDQVLHPEVLTGESLGTGALHLAIPSFVLRPPVEDGITECFLRKVDLLRAHGVAVQVVEYDPTPVFARCERELLFAEFARDMPRYLADRRGPNLRELRAGLVAPLATAVVDEVLEGDGTDPIVYAQAVLLRDELVRIHATAFARHDIDALIYPTVPSYPTLLTDTTTTHIGNSEVSLEALNRNIGPSTVIGSPSVAVPLGGGVAGLPISLCIEGLPNTDIATLSIAGRVAALLRSPVA